MKLNFSFPFPIFKDFFRLVVKNFFEEFDENDGTVEVEKDQQRYRDPLNDDPLEFAKEFGLNYVGMNLIKNIRYVGTPMPL